MNYSIFCRAALPLVTMAVVTLAGCANAPSSAPREGEKPAASPRPALAAPGPAAAELSRAAAQRDLTDGIALYDRGEFNAAIAKLGGSPDLAAAAPETQLVAFKYLAFSFCVTNRQAQCRTQFEHAFKLDPAFDLAPAERGHPLWGPVFERVKKAQPRPRT